MIARSLVRWRSKERHPAAASRPASAGRLTVIADSRLSNYLILIGAIRSVTGPLRSRSRSILRLPVPVVQDGVPTPSSRERAVRDGIVLYEQAVAGPHD